MIYRAFIVLVFVAVIVGSVMLGGQQHEPVSTTTIDQAAAGLGYAARQARVIETGPDGRALYTLDANLITEPPGGTRIQLQQMQMTFRVAEGQEWTGRADYGVAEQDIARVELFGNVRVSGLLPGSDTQANISTERALVDTRAQAVTTDEPVTLTTADSTVHAKGLSANLTEGVVQLKSNVHGTYSR
jgi:LPS export ABC transporter protein LptC